MLAIITNTTIIVLILGLALWQLIRVFKRAKRGKCAACEMECAIKKQIKTQKQ